MMILLLSRQIYIWKPYQTINLIQVQLILKRSK